jgi:hypothetical protein
VHRAAPLYKDWPVLPIMFEGRSLGPRFPDWNYRLMEFLFRIVPHQRNYRQVLPIASQEPSCQHMDFRSLVLHLVDHSRRQKSLAQDSIVLDPPCPQYRGADYIRFPTLDCVVRTRPHDRVPVALPTALARSWNRRLLPESCHARLHDGGHGSLAASQRHKHGAGNSRVALDRDPKNLRGRTLSNRHPCFAGIGGCSACSLHSGNARTQRGSRAG